MEDNPLSAPIRPQTDPSKIIGVVRNDPQPRTEPDLPPIPEPGFYWAKVLGGDGTWEPVLAYETEFVPGQRNRHVDSIGWDAGCAVLEWGPKLEPPSDSSFGALGGVLVASGAPLTKDEASLIKNWLDYGLMDPDERSAAIAAIDRVTAR